MTHESPGTQAARVVHRMFVLMSQNSPLSVAEVIAIHERIVKRSDTPVKIHSLRSAVARQWSGIGEQELYPDVASKVGALIHGIAHNHPFVDGNKRTALAAGAALALLYGFDLYGKDDEELVELMVATVSGDLSVDGVIERVAELLHPLE